MMSTTCQIAFENDGVFNPGQLLKGTARMKLSKGEKIRGVFVRIFGSAHTDWSEWCNINHNPKPDSKPDFHTVEYSSEVYYLKEISYFVGAENAGEVKRFHLQVLY